MLFYKANGKKEIRHASNIKPAATATGGEAPSTTTAGVTS